MEQAITDLLYESFWLLVIGMAVVFSFLTLLIGAIKLIEKSCAAFPEPGSDPVNASPSSSSLSTPSSISASASQSAVIAPEVIAAITAALHQHRKKAG